MKSIDSYWGLSGIYFFYFALLGGIGPYWNLYLSDIGFNALEIGYLSAVLMGTKVISPYILGWLTDKTRQPVKIIRLSNFLAFICFLFIYLLPEKNEGSAPFWRLMLIVGGFSFFWNAVIAQYEALTFSILGRRHDQYGLVRAWGSVGFVIAVVGLGYLFESTGIEQLQHIIAALLALVWLSSFCVSQPVTAIPEANESIQGILSYLKKPEIIAFFAGCFLVKLAHGPYYTFYTIYLDHYGYSNSLIGWLWSLGVLAELGMFFIIGKLFKRFSLRFVLIASALTGVVRWLVIGFAPMSIGLLIMSQLLHATTFASYHVAAVNWVRVNFDKSHMGQGQALYSATSFGAGSALGAILSGVIWTDAQSGAWTVCWVLAAGVSIAAGLAFAYRRSSSP